MDEQSVKLSRRRVDLNTALASAILCAGLILFSSLFPGHIAFALSIPASLLVILMGFGLPRWIGSGIRKEHAEKRKTQERAKWGFYSRDREGPWINYVDHPVVLRTAVADGKRFYSDWLIIHDGKVIVNPGTSTVHHDSHTVAYDPSRPRTYAWDGCTPKRLFYWIAVIGTPDWWHAAQAIETIDHAGRIADKDVVWQVAHHASLVHDALYQYLEHIPIDKKDVDRLFYDLLVEAGLPRLVAKIYHWFVCLFGPKGDPAIAQVDNGHYRLIFYGNSGEPSNG
jgi:hypothetical protein